MEILPITSTYFVRLPRVSTHNDNFGQGLVKTIAREKNSYRFINPFRFFRDSPRRKDKVIFVLGSTGTGKSKLAIDLAIHFGSEVVNSDKMQVYAGLNIITNKVTVEECAGIPHHLIGGVGPDADFTASDFRVEATRAVESILTSGKLPIIAGGSNSFIEELVDGEGGGFRTKYDCCFIWIDVDLLVLHKFVSTRVDKMVGMGLVGEARGMFDLNADYTKGIRRSIGIQEMDRYFRGEGSLEEAIDEIKANTRNLTFRQLQKIQRLCTLPGWNVYRVDATEAFEKQEDKVWNRVAREPSIKLVQSFLNRHINFDKVSVDADETAIVAVAVAAACDI